jgi:hypothetical protein
MSTLVAGDSPTIHEVHNVCDNLACEVTTKVFGNTEIKGLKDVFETACASLGCASWLDKGVRLY